MGSLRANNFEDLLNIYSEVKNLQKRCNGVIRSALNKISRKLFNLTNWQASNEAYWEYLKYAATRLNILWNHVADEEIKAIIFKIYKKICAVLPDNFQLLLFAQDTDFGWNFRVDSENWETGKLRYTPNRFWDTLDKFLLLAENFKEKVKAWLGEAFTKKKNIEITSELSYLA